jgi:ribonuclease P protein subunit POP4
MITPQNIAQHEIIGLEVRVMESRNKSFVGMKGRVVDETLSTLTIETPKGDKKIAKAGTTLLFVLPSGIEAEIYGNDIVARPEDRIKKKR